MLQIRDVDRPERPVEVLTPLSSTEALVGETATFTCQLSKLNQDVVWKVGDKVVKASDDKYEVESHDLDYTLKIKNCALDDAGEVSLTIEDQKTSAQLVVAGKTAFRLFTWYFYRIHFIITGFQLAKQCTIIYVEKRSAVRK